MLILRLGTWYSGVGKEVISCGRESPPGGTIVPSTELFVNMTPASVYTVLSRGGHTKLPVLVFELELELGPYQVRRNMPAPAKI